MTMPHASSRKADVECEKGLWEQGRDGLHGANLDGNGACFVIFYFFMVADSDSLIFIACVGFMMHDGRMVYDS